MTLEEEEALAIKTAKEINIHINNPQAMLDFYTKINAVWMLENYAKHLSRIICKKTLDNDS